MKKKYFISIITAAILTAMLIFTSCSDNTKTIPDEIPSDKISSPSDISVVQPEFKPEPYVCIKFIGHRGLSAVAPENTIPSFVAAGKHGMWGTECDIVETADGNFVLCHDTTVNSMTNGEGAIAYQSLDSLKRLTVDYGSAVWLYPDLRLATLEEYLDCCAQYNMVPVIEIKRIYDSSISNLINILKKYGVENKAILIFNNYEQIHLVRAISDINIQFLQSKNSTADECIAALDKIAEVDNLNIALFHMNVEKSVVDYAHKLGIKINVWVVDDPTAIDRLLGFGVDYITTNLVVDGKNIPTKLCEVIDIVTKTDIKKFITSELREVSASDFKEDGDITNTYCYDEKNNIISFNSYDTGGIHCKIDCDIGSTILVEYDYYAIDAVPQLKIDAITLIPAEADSLNRDWEHVSLAIPIRSAKSCDIYIGMVSGKYKLRNIKIKCIKI